MKPHKGYNITMMLLVAMLMLTSCRDDLCYNHFPAVALSLDWEQEWERDHGRNHRQTWDEALHGFGYDELRPGMPEWVNMLKYGDSIRTEEDFCGPEGGRIIVGNDLNQSILLYNGDTQYIILSDKASVREVRASATTRSRASLTYVMQRHPDSRSTNPPDMLYSAYIEKMPPAEVHETKPVTVKMQPLVFTYVIRYEFEHGIEYVALARGALGGMAESVYLRDGKTSDRTSIVLFDAEIKDYGCEARVQTFGVPDFKDENYGDMKPMGQENSYTLNLEVRLKNGKIIEFNYDITDQIAGQPRGGVIRVDGISVDEEEARSESGFDVEVTDWGNHVDIDLPI